MEWQSSRPICRKLYRGRFILDKFTNVDIDVHQIKDNYHQTMNWHYLTCYCILNGLHLEAITIRKRIIIWSRTRNPRKNIRERMKSIFFSIKSQEKLSLILAIFPRIEGSLEINLMDENRLSRLFLETFTQSLLWSSYH
jgi:hypothetical protein